MGHVGQVNRGEHELRSRDRNLAPLHCDSNKATEKDSRRTAPGTLGAGSRAGVSLPTWPNSARFYGDNAAADTPLPMLPGRPEPLDGSAVLIRYERHGPALRGIIACPAAVMVTMIAPAVPQAGLHVSQVGRHRDALQGRPAANPRRLPRSP